MIRDKIERINVWSEQPLNYKFNRIFGLLSIMYIFATLFDLCLTYLSFKFMPEVFFKYELSYVIKMSYGGDAFFSAISVIFFVFPLIIIYSYSRLNKKKYGHHTNVMRILLYVLYSTYYLHMFGGFTNFFQLINI